MIKYIFLLFFFLTNLVTAEDLQIDCDTSNNESMLINFNKEVSLCYSVEGILITHYGNSYKFEFINHIESQFYIIKTLPTGFRCRDGILIGRALPPPKYQPENALYIYKLVEGKYGLEPKEPVTVDQIPYGKYLMTLARFEGRSMKALTILTYNGLKEVSKGKIIFLPLTSEKSYVFDVVKCRVVMNDFTKLLNKLTINRR